MNTTAKSATKHIADLHFEHQMWTNELEFAKDQIKTFQVRMEEIAKRYSASDVLAGLEQLQNRYIREREVIDILLHDINKHEEYLVGEFQQAPVAIEHRLFTDHAGLRDRMEQFTKLNRELRNELFHYLAKWM